MTYVHLSNYDWDIEIDVENGSLFQRCRFGNQQIFRDFNNAKDSRFLQHQSGHFPLLPFSNRIENSSFKFENHQVSLPVNAPDQSHAIHGFGWLSRWTVEKSDDGYCELVYLHKTAEWPWDYRARQQIFVKPNRLRLELEVINESNSNMPCGLGFHPYFPDLENAYLSFDARGVWEADKDFLPTRHTAITDKYDFSNPRRLKFSWLDHCFTDVGKAILSWDNQPMQIEITSSENLNKAAVYTAHDDNCFCFEPISHTHNALNMPDPVKQGMKILAQGASIQAWCEILVTRR